jgi:hypothetical protein
MTIKKFVPLIAISVAVGAAGAPTAASVKGPIPQYARRDLMADVILAAWGAACWCARIPRNFEEQRQSINRV